MKRYEEHVQFKWEGLPEIPGEKQDAFIQHVRYALFRHKKNDTIRHPNAPGN